ncbi:hypothetical protein HYH03_018721 [Edaphochlamys debaryana]|uniref:Protein SYS1 homolog n=1 Tax=Edaphochlamys debaryana TaxID=47281 RepID=A0A835XGG2_9CHLO|nr:hypothetical protein HYH03_018721 [Edaphochlamys debaryana]|eukprot:KAG2482333.1 hypothetical protein HYH03_018721 [Edaphochlamys debaryana]
MGTKADGETKTIIKKLAIYIPCFYLIYYIWSIILVGALHVDWHELGAYPFRIRKDEFSPAHRDAALGAWLAMVLTFLCSLGLTYRVVAATRRAWDYVATCALVHLVLCIIVNQAFPVNWIWWVTLLLATLAVALAAEFINYRLIDLREIELDRV